MPLPTVLSSNQSTPIAKESGANTHPWRRTPDLVVNQATILSGILSMVSSNRSDDRLSNRHRPR